MSLRDIADKDVWTPKDRRRMQEYMGCAGPTPEEIEKNVIEPQTEEPENETAPMKVTIALAMWHNGQKWNSYAEGWHLTEKQTKDNLKTWVEDTILENGLNEGFALYWRFIEADVPVPENHEPTIQEK